jgi:hypothetical protein
VANPQTPGLPPWTDWEELIDPLKNPVGWQWVTNDLQKSTVTFSDDGTVNGAVSQKVNPNDFVKFDFNPEFPGVTVTVVKWLTWTGAIQNPGMVWIDEYPTPEPSTIILLISGLLALGLGYIRRRK